MRVSVLSLVVWALCSLDAAGLTLRRATGAADQPRALSLDMQRRRNFNHLEHDRVRIRKRSGTVLASLQNDETLYFVNVSIGTPAQTLKLHIDTGSSDLWVNTPSSTLCSRRRACASTGTYTANSSSTYQYIASDFNISYVDGSGASGDYVADTVAISSAPLTSQQFGIGYKSSSTEGILGIGYAANEVQVGRNSRSAYKNVPENLASQGFINTNAYSLWLNDLDSSTGSILFGGVDTAKFSGELATVPIQKNNGVYAEFLITLTALTLGSTTIASGQALAVLADSGTSLTYLPNSWASTIFTAMGAQYDSSEGAAFIPCSQRTNTSLSVTFTFSGASIVVDMSELVLDVTTSSGSALTFSNGQKACLFGIAPAGSSTSVIGDTFLRSAYVVYDLANNEISIAQTVFNASASNVLEITSGSSGVPQASAVSKAIAATAGVVAGSAVTGSTDLGSDAKSAAMRQIGASGGVYACASVMLGIVIGAVFL